MKQPLSPELSAWLEGYNVLIEELRQGGYTDTPQTVRSGLARLTETLVTDVPNVAGVMDLQAVGATGNIPLRVYRADTDRVSPVLVYLHGGGHMAGSVDVYDPICRKLALACDRVVVSVDYRLAPEHPYPAGLEDATAVLRQVYGLLENHGIGCDRRLALAGDSGGGAMTATLVHRLQHDDTVRIEKQVLVYPSLDYCMQHPSMRENGQGYLLHADKIEWYFRHYLQHGEDRRAVSPLYMEFSNSLPPTLLVTAGYDPLLDEALAYRDRLADTGVECRHLHFPDQLHAFLNMENVTRDA